MAGELDFKYKIDVVQEGEPNTNGEMIIIYNYDGAELTPELLAKTLEELSTQASLNRSGVGESILLDESGKIIHQDASDANIIKVESEANGSLLGLEQSEICTGDFGNSSALLTTAESWENLKEEHNIQLEVIAQDATSGASIGSSYLTPLIDNGSLPQSETNKSARGDYTCVVNDNTFSNHNDIDTSQYKPKYENSGPLDHNISDKTDFNKQLQCVEPKHDASVLKTEISKIEYHCKECSFTAFAEIELQRHLKMEHYVLEPFVCQYCLKAFKLELTLDIHKLSHTTQVDAPKINLKHIHKVSKFFSCPICDFQYQRKPQLMVHMASTHHGDKYFFCNDCSYSCLTQEKLLHHTQTTSHKDEQCTVCPLCGASTKNLRQHVRTAHNENRPFLCTTCGFKAKTATNLKTHMHIHDPIKQIHCSQCSYKCRTKDQLKKHMVRHSSEKKFKCGLCTFACKTSMSLKRHMQIHQAPGKYICNICRFSTHDKLLLKDHKTTQHKLKPRYICRECSLEFERPLELRKHALSVHKSDKTQFCSYCDFSCSTTTQLRTHLEQHFGKFSYACHICGYSSRIKASYRRHMERHNKVKNYKCELCDYACVEKYDLQKHIAHRHSEEKPYSCPYCSYSCKFKPRLNNHISFIHSDEKPFFCKECSYAGKSAESLKKHMVHHGVLPVSSKAIQCVLCDYATHERAKLRRHMKGHVNKAFIEIQTVE